MYSHQRRFLSKLINERQTSNSLWVDNMEESQVTTVKQNRDGMNNLSQENTFLLFKHQNFLLKHTQNITYLFATANISTGSVQFLILLVRR